MKSELAKPLHTVCGKTMLSRVIESLAAADCGRVTVVVGVDRNQVIASLEGSGIETVVQEEQKGTGHAVDCARSAYEDFDGDVIVMYGDIPLVRPATLRSLVDAHRQGSSVATMLTAHMSDPTGYGRIVRDEDGYVVEVMEQADVDAQREVRPELAELSEINTGIYCFRASFLFEALGHLNSDNAQGEYYLPDVLKYFRREKMAVAAIATLDSDEIMGVNDRVQLARAEKICHDRIVIQLMRDGVTIVDPYGTYIEDTVRIGADTVIRPGAQILGNTTIGRRCEIGDGVLIEDSTLGDRCRVLHCSAVRQSTAESDVEIGPFANVRGNSTLRQGCVVGLSEVNRSVIGECSKSRHFAYIGDSVVGAKVNIGAGAITCNYDGVNHLHTEIEDGVFIGSDTILVAPLKIGKNAYTAAGSTITMDVPAWSLAVGRAHQRNIARWAERMAKKRNGQ